MFVRLCSALACCAAPESAATRSAGVSAGACAALGRASAGAPAQRCSPANQPCTEVVRVAPRSAVTLCSLMSISDNGKMGELAPATDHELERAFLTAQSGLARCQERTCWRPPPVRAVNTKSACRGSSAVTWHPRRRSCVRAEKVRYAHQHSTRILNRVCVPRP